MNILLVRQILKVSVLVYSLASRGVETISTLVLIRTICHVHANSNHSENVRGEDGTHTKWIERCLLSLKKLGCDDVGYAVSNEDHGIGCHFLGVTTIGFVSVIFLSIRSRESELTQCWRCSFRALQCMVQDRSKTCRVLLVFR